ncbi:MAG TPA: 23S rRNA (adenine(2030)-N(6))-methyltransferase RlmJ [Steroidobacteraceae bacterium]|nr:23S rRNA (adenine(2030)-N(6))-methyltransferase RlmJ [Steroidobacteraceae bacterium]
MKYRHRFHAGNFADVHKHVTLLALLAALQRKDKGFLYLETHAGRGSYDLRDATHARAALDGVARVLAAAAAAGAAPELVAYAAGVDAWRRERASECAYPGSPLLAVRRLRPQDRALLLELSREESSALAQVLPVDARARVECADGFEALRAHLPPRERRGLILIDPPYEETAEDFARARRALADGLRRFATGVFALWYPLKDRRDLEGWKRQLATALDREALLSELWVHPCDSRVALNGSGIVIVNPPYQLDTRMQQWLPALHRLLDPEGSGGFALQAL